jgi:branched-chain amino acid transport system ATP-binding protein
MTMLETRGLSAYYGDFQALFGIDVVIHEGETVAIIGSNGAGKTTFLRAIMGQMRCQPDAVYFDGAAIGGRATHKVVELGIALVPEGRRLFPSLSVDENLLMGSYCGRPGPWTLDRVYRLFPALRERRGVRGTALSGGEQQMAAIGRSLMANPRLLLCDEISLGLAPIVIKSIYQVVRQIGAEGTTVLVVEQDINQALTMSDRFYCFQEGRVSLEGRPSEVSREQIKSAYFGV